MSWKWISSSHPVSDIRDWSNQQRLEIRPDFQRKEVWSPAARILLMDTILRNIPMPKIFLQAVIRNDDTYRIVIDGQQRIKAILSFLRGDFRLSKPYSGEFQDKTFSQLPSNMQEDFLSYKVDINEIRNAPDDVIRDIYLRVNKYTVALNKQELRRADFPGEFLWLAEELANEPFFEEARIFTVANSKRMGDVEFVSELLALLLAGPQDKRETLDNFYLQFSEWDKTEKERIKIRFKAVIADLLTLSGADNPEGLPFSKLRFRQKADFYSLFAAIDDCILAGGSLSERPLAPLKEDLMCIHHNTEPESDVEIFRNYAIKCVSQGNSLASRRWRRDFFRHFLHGTYFSQPPSIEGVQMFHEILSAIYTPGICPTTVSECPICEEEDIENYSTENVFLTWDRTKSVCQMTNAVFIHNSCRSAATEKFYVWDEDYSIKPEHVSEKELKGDGHEH